MSRLGQRLIDHAVSVMPEHRRDWAEAMRAEFHALPTDREALAWATGCVWASYCERIEPMQVFLKSLLRAAAEGLVVAAFILGLLYLPPPWASNAHVGGLLIVLLMYTGGMFATLCILELAIARFWTAPGKSFQKTLLRAAVMGLWPVGWEVSIMIGVWRNPLVHDPLVHFGVNFATFMQGRLIEWAGDYSVYFAAMFMPLLICELAFALYGRTKAAPV